VTADLAGFLRARLDDDELVARDANTSPEMVTGIPRSYAAAPVAMHIGRWDPKRVLAEVDAKRRIIADLLDERHDRNEEDHWYSCAAIVDNEGELLCLDASRAGGPCDCGRDRRVERRLKILALPYAAHPDYRPEWVPDA
jgi:hypothetical protein